MTKLQKVPLYFNPEYPGVRPVAECHPGAEWLRKNGRDPAMAKGVEFTDARTFEAEVTCTRRPRSARRPATPYSPAGTRGARGCSGT